MQFATLYAPVPGIHAGPRSQECRLPVMAGEPVEGRYVIPS
jgi:hypothetical protein